MMDGNFELLGFPLFGYAGPGSQRLQVAKIWCSWFQDWAAVQELKLSCNNMGIL